MSVQQTAGTGELPLSWAAMERPADGSQAAAEDRPVIERLPDTGTSTPPTGAERRDTDRFATERAAGESYSVRQSADERPGDERFTAAAPCAEGPGELSDDERLAPPDMLEPWTPPDEASLGAAVDLSPSPQPDEVAAYRRPILRGLFEEVRADHRNYYSTGNLLALSAGVGVAAALANSRADENIRDFYQDNIRDADTDEYFEALHAPKILGDGNVMIPVYAAAAVTGHLLDDRPLGRGVGGWGRRSLRTILVGAPPMLLMQMATGAGRPSETYTGSRWTPLQDNNGVSGHSFMGAIPLITAAKMTDNLFWKAVFYTGSTLPGISRINDDRHYASQVILGWWMAYLAATAVDGRPWGPEGLSVFPLPLGDGVGLGLEYRH